MTDRRDAVREPTSRAIARWLLILFYGLAGVAHLVFTGMSQKWYVGPIALTAGISPFGGDVGFELGFAFAAVGYLILRPIELRIFKR